MRNFYHKKPNLTDNLIWLLWALGYAFCFPTYGASPLIWIIFIPVIVYAWRKPIYLTVRYAFLYSLVFWLVTLFWLVAFHEASLPFFAPGYSLYFAFFFFLIAYFGQKVRKLRWLAFPMLWISQEFLRSIGYLGFQWNLVANTQYRFPVMLQSADLWGVWGVGFIIMLVNGALAELVDAWIEQGNFRKAAIQVKTPLIITGAVFTFNLIYGIATFYYYRNLSAHSPKEKLALMQPNIGSHEPWWSRKWDYYMIFWKMHAEAALQNPDTIVWSETMVRNFLWYYKKYARPHVEISDYVDRYLMMPFEFDTPILLSHPERDNQDHNFNSVTYIDPKNGQIRSYAKIHLCPFGEWMPYYEYLPVVRDVLKQAGAAAYTPSKELTVFRSRKGKFAVMICFEDIFAELARRFVKKGANYFLNTTNDGWAYRWEVGTQLPLWQHMAGIVPVAISTRRPIARAVNDGVTGVIDITGEMDVAPIPLYTRGVYVTDISVIDEKLQTVYVRFGHLFPYIIFFLTFGMMTYAFFGVKKGNAEWE